MENKNTATPMFTFKVPYNSQEVLSANQQMGKKGAIGVLLGSFVFFAIFVLSLLNENTTIWVNVIFGAIAVALLIYAIVLLLNKGSANSKNENLVYKFMFFNNGLQIATNSKRNIENFKVKIACLYRKSGNKQYVAKVIESTDNFTFKIYTGTYNFVPQYKEYVLPKKVFENEEQLNVFIGLIKPVFNSDYINK